MPLPPTTAVRFVSERVMTTLVEACDEEGSATPGKNKKAAWSFLFTWVAATMVGVLWITVPSYVYDDSCIGDSCWPFIAVISAYALCGAFAYPFFR